MRGVFVILRKEFIALARSGGSVFVVYAVLTLAWSTLFATSGDRPSSLNELWLVFFAVLISANFSTTVFIAERTGGSLEILITSGLSRDAVLFGKMGFVAIMTMIVGAVCSVCAAAVKGAGIGSDTHIGLLQGKNALLYAAAAVANIASGAFFSVRLDNPRVLHIVNLLLIMGMVALYTALAQSRPVPTWTLTAGLALVAGVFTVLARREFNGERIVRRIIL